jgi:hypothetical protein
MKASKYAPKTPAETLAQSRTEKVKQEKENAARLLGRIRWKAELLMVSYYKALEIVRASDARQEAHNGQEPISVSDRSAAAHIRQGANFVKKQAESMFKVDFFEWYVLLERYITLCLSVLGVSVSAAPATYTNALRYITNPDLHKTRPMASHAFHANLLEALDDVNGPLYSSFGVQDVRIQLGLAKDFRNAWKDADGRVIASKWGNETDESRKNITLHDSQLELMLRALLAGCDHAHGVVQAHTNSQPNGSGLTSRDFEPQTFSQSDSMSNDAPFEYMDDAMELD